MDYSPLPSPAFSASSGSTLPTVVSTFKTNARHQMFDLQKLLMDDPTSVNVKRAKVLSIVKAFSLSIDKILRFLVTLSNLLGEFPDQSIHEIRAVLCEKLTMLQEHALLCDKRLHYAADSFKQLIYYERQSLELNSKIAKLQKEVQKESDEMKQYAFKDMLRAVECERDQHVLTFANLSDMVCRNIMEQINGNIEHFCNNVWYPATNEVLERLKANEEQLVKLGFRGFDQIFYELGEDQ